MKEKNIVNLAKKSRLIQLLSIKIITVGIVLFFNAMTAIAASGTYFAGGLGWSTQSGMPTQGELAPEGATEQDEENFTGRISLGYNHDFSTLFGLGTELSWGHYAETNYGVGTMNSSAWDLTLVSTFSPTPNYSLIAKAGIAREALTVPDAFSSVLGGNHTEYNPLVGLGLGFNLTDNWQLHVDYLHFFGEDLVLDTESTATPTLDSVMIGIKRTFG